MNYEAILYTSGASTLLTILVSTYLFRAHLQRWTKPVQQANILYIVLMAPLFAIDSFVGLLELEAGETMAHVLDMVKECYEAVAIHAFLMLMYDLCGLTDHIKKTSLPLPEGVKGRELHFPFPLSLAFKGSHPHLDQLWVQRLRRWTLQFVLVRPVLSIADLIFVDLLEDFPPSKFIGLLITIGLNVSVTTAFFALLTFYHAFEEELAPYRPLAKLICIKGVVFFSTWQGLVLKGLAAMGVLHEGHRFSVHEIALAYQDVLVCVEMGVLFCPLYLYAFDPKEYATTTDDDAKKKKKE